MPQLDITRSLTYCTPAQLEASVLTRGAVIYASKVTGRLEQKGKGAHAQHNLLLQEIWSSHM